MRINVYEDRANSLPVRTRKWVKNILEAQSFCAWYRRTYGTSVNFVICK